MWEKVVSYLLTAFIPASLLTSTRQDEIPPLKLTVAPLAWRKQEAREPVTKAKAVFILENHSHEVLYHKNIWEPLPIASLTKLMTALIVREHVDLDTVVTVSPIIKSIQGSRMKLIPGEKITVRNLLKGLLIDSGNDAAYVLSEIVSGSPEKFVELMNEKSQQLGLEHTHFVDPAGIDDQNTSSAFDLAQLAQAVFKDGFLQSVMREKKINVFSWDKKQRHLLQNTNLLLGSSISDRIIAGKTGTSPSAGQTLISSLTHDPNQTILIILLGSPDRFQEMENLIQWVDSTFSWE